MYLRAPILVFVVSEQARLITFWISSKLVFGVGLVLCRKHALFDIPILPLFSVVSVFLFIIYSLRS